MIEEMAKFYGAKVVSEISSSVTHIIMDVKDLSRWSEIRKLDIHKTIHIVNQDWIEESISCHEDLDECSFSIRNKL
jgi:hypothetical protein